jgi:hypothetical protein
MASLKFRTSIQYILDGVVFLHISLATNIISIFLFVIMTIPAVWSKQPAIQWVSGGHFPGIMCVVRQDDHSSSSRLEIKVISPCPYIFMEKNFVKHGDNFILICFTYLLLGSMALLSTLTSITKDVHSFRFMPFKTLVQEEVFVFSF